MYRVSIANFAEGSDIVPCKTWPKTVFFLVLSQDPPLSSSMLPQMRSLLCPKEWHTAWPSCPHPSWSLVSHHHSSPISPHSGPSSTRTAIYCYLRFPLNDQADWHHWDDWNRPCFSKDAWCWWWVNVRPTIGWHRSHPQFSSETAASNLVI